MGKRLSRQRRGAGGVRRAPAGPAKKGLTRAARQRKIAGPARGPGSKRRALRQARRASGLGGKGKKKFTQSGPAGQPKPKAPTGPKPASTQTRRAPGKLGTPGPVRQTAFATGGTVKKVVRKKSKRVGKALASSKRGFALGGQVNEEVVENGQKGTRGPNGNFLPNVNRDALRAQFGKSKRNKRGKVISDRATKTQLANRRAASSKERDFEKSSDLRRTLTPREQKAFDRKQAADAKAQASKVKRGRRPKR